MSSAAAAPGQPKSEGPGWSDTVMMPLTAGRRVLHVLTGGHTGAESEITTERILIGNLESECDIVLDVKRDERHACLVRVTDDDWSLLAIAGELWLDASFIEPQQTRALHPGQVITLGRVSFAIADPDLIDWHSLKAPYELVKPAPDGPVPQAALLPSRPAVMQKWRALKLAAGLGLSAMVLASAVAYLSDAWGSRPRSAQELELKLQADQQMVKALPFGKELTLTPHPDKPSKVLVQGYVPERRQLALLDEALQRVDTKAEYRVVAVDELGTEVAKRFDRVARSEVQYDKLGRFELPTAAETLPTHDRQARVALQELPTLDALALKANDITDPDGKPVVVRYERSTERPGDLVVTNLDTALGHKPYTVREVRLGDMPSVVLNDGLRYFVDAKLPDGGRVQSITEDRMVVKRPSGATTTIGFDEVSISRPEPQKAAANKRR
jgi:hypothetical protein